MGNNVVCSEVRKPASKMRKQYILKLIFRCIVFVGSIILYIVKPQELDILDGWNFFKRFSVLHVMWFIWMFDMIHQIIPMKNHLPIGSQKVFKRRYQPSENIDPEALKKFTKKNNRGAYLVLAIWVAFVAVINILYRLNILATAHLFLVSVAFYVCDLICVLIWCPFRLIMRTRCCTTCRIFNWDHMMMFTPMFLVCGFYSLSLLSVSLIAWGVWEVSALLHPERFWDGTNVAMRCANCTDKLCTQFCPKAKK